MAIYSERAALNLIVEWLRWNEGFKLGIINDEGQQYWAIFNPKNEMTTNGPTFDMLWWNMEGYKHGA